MTPMSRKDLEALVKNPVAAHKNLCCSCDVNEITAAVTGALWGAMEPARYYGMDESETARFVSGDSERGDGFRALICTDPPEADAVKLAREAKEVKRLVDGMTMPVSIIKDSIRAGELCHAVDALVIIADRILRG